MKQTFYYALLSLFLFSFGCVPANTEEMTEVKLDLNDPVLKKIFKYQDEAQTDSLIAVFDDKNPTYRYLAAMAFGSNQDKKAVTALARLLDDNVEEVRSAAAYSLGQIGDPVSENLLIASFDTLAAYKNFNKTLLEAIGKCGTEQSLENISSVRSYTVKDTALLTGQAWSIYRFGLRGMTVPQGTQRMLNLVGNEEVPNRVRYIAANYLSRVKIPPLDSTQVYPIINMLSEEKDVNIRMALVVAVGKSKSDLALLALENLFERERDYRVKCNILRTLGNFDYAKVQALALKTLQDQNPKVARSAAEFFYENGESREASVYWRKAKDAQDWTVKMKMYHAANKYMAGYFTDYKWLINDELRKMAIDPKLNIYQRAEALKGLGEYSRNYKVIFENGFNDTIPVIKTAAVEAIAKIASNPDFDLQMGASKKDKAKKIISTYLAKAINEGDAAMRAVAAKVLSKDLGYRELYDNSSFLHVAKRDLKLPQETETLYEIQKAIDFFDGKKTETEIPAFNNPIDWNLLEGLTENSTATVKTSKGNVTFELLPMYAPGSVANFIKLAQEGYFKDKNFHRVVSNFVVQGGCPRGDGYGGKNYTIRSELPNVYYDKGGYVGMASAGNHTECTQWFITHSPTPHLDGKYTIFAKVKEGMDVVHKLEVGDPIVDVIINK